MSGDRDAHARDIVLAGRRLYERGLIVANEGNLSVRLDRDRVLTTARGLCKGTLGPADLVVVDMEGKKVEGELEPSTEVGIHLTAYRARVDVCAIVHAHPPFATAFAVAGIPLDRLLMPEVVVLLGTVPVARYGTPSTPDLPASIAPHVEEHDAILLANHGAVTFGRDLWEAFFRMESLEHYALISLVTRFLGRARELTAGEVAALEAIRHRYGAGDREDDCLSCRFHAAARTPGAAAEDAGAAPAPEPASGRAPEPGEDRITVTRGELARLIEDAVRAVART